ncbi:MAG TPA: pilus assembly PilX N-terminal domain-containing protein [Candidatus Saccharimonadales bacterium]|nr:pilus assembly PilX N-terminal domain-containing protein [Candidatus Saccharimonadales bacterium]
MSNLYISKPTVRASEVGMISIMTTMVLMIIISLIALGFAQISRRNQRESLDRQLSTQAFYAAESGVNDARNLIANAVNSGTAVPDKAGCDDNGTGAFYAALNPVLDAARNVEYSCLLVDTAPTELRYSDVGTPSTIIPMTSATGANFSRIDLSWQAKSGASPITSCPTSTTNVFRTGATWNCGYGVLRFDLVPASGGGLSIDGLRNSTMTTFAVPFSSGGTNSVAYAAGSANTNNLIGIACNNTGCSLSITGLTTNSYYMRVTSLYKNVALQVTADDNAGNAIELQGAQAVIDSTGKSEDVLRRIQVNVPIRSTSKNELSDYAIQSTDAICKRFSVMQGYFDATASGVTSTNRLCQP